MVGVRSGLPYDTRGYTWSVSGLAYPMIHVVIHGRCQVWLTL